MDHALYKKLKVTEFFNQNWTKEDKLNLSPTICEISRRFNGIGSWVIREIISPNRVEERAIVIQKFIGILMVTFPLLFSLFIF